MIDWIVLWSFPVLTGAAIGGFAWRYFHKKGEERYWEGVREGQQRETDWARRQAVEQYKMELRRKMYDSGRRAMARADAPTARIHRVQLARGNRSGPQSQL